MPREFDVQKFRRVFQDAIVGGMFNEESQYYPRYRSRYEAVMRRYSRIAGPAPLDVLDIGGGQLALLTKLLWGDNATAADISVDGLDYVRGRGVSTVGWNLCSEDQPFAGRFDFIFFSEVIEHLPIPGHIPLERLRKALRPGGKVICTTPNLYRPRNIVYMLLNHPIYDHFRFPTNQGLGHVIEYDREHLRWQFEQAGFANVRVDREQFPHHPNRPAFRLLSLLGTPLFLFPRFRDNLVAVGEAPAGEPAPAPARDPVGAGQHAAS